MELTHFSLFSGIGGIDLAAEWAGFRTVGFCEKDKFCQKVLRKYWPGVPIWEDVRNVTKESLEKAGIRAVDLISGGFPCQPFSVAGKRRGKADDRYLWPEMFRVISEVRPAWVLGENVANFVNMGLDDALSDLEGIGYETQAFVIPACAVGAPHRRDRVFIVAYTESSKDGRFNCAELFKRGTRLEFASSNQRCTKNKSCKNVAHSTRQLPHGGRDARTTRRNEPANSSWWTVEPNVGRVAHGIPNRVDRLKALGNAVVPQQVYPILKAIYKIKAFR